MFTYSLLPHNGPWGAPVERQAYFLNMPVYALKGAAGHDFSFAGLSHENVILETVKAAEDGRGMILRMYESHNTTTNAVLRLHAAPKSVYECDLMENDETPVALRDREIAFTIKPYEIKTFRIV